MATTRPTPAKRVTRSDNPSVPQSGSKPVARKSVAGSGTRARKKPQEITPRQAPLPSVQPTRPQTGRTSQDDNRIPAPTDRYPRVDSAVLLSGFKRAERAGAPENVEWDAAKQQWVVPSATDPGRTYRLWRRRGRKGPLPFYVALECNCPAEQSGSYICCWHKCAVKLWLNDWFRDNAFGDALDTLDP